MNNQINHVRVIGLYCCETGVFDKDDKKIAIKIRIKDGNLFSRWRSLIKFDSFAELDKI